MSKMHWGRVWRDRTQTVRRPCADRTQTIRRPYADHAQTIRRPYHEIRRPCTGRLNACACACAWRDAHTGLRACSGTLKARVNRERRTRSGPLRWSRWSFARARAVARTGAPHVHSCLCDALAQRPCRARHDPLSKPASDGYRRVAMRRPSPSRVPCPSPRVAPCHKRRE